jgi:hypothetical protein
VVLESLQGGTVEFRIPDNVTCGVDQRDPVSGSDASLIGERVRVDVWPPLSRYESRFTGQVMSCLFDDAGVKLVVDDEHDRDHHYTYDRERLKQQSGRELHDRSLTFLIR